MKINKFSIIAIICFFISLSVFFYIKLFKVNLNNKRDVNLVVANNEDCDDVCYE
ncbi:MAG: hypothetical protein P9X22_09535 [Candidatus Zapsychrus exili]|nr:hypothetical protein [Candidatus Zapsychrus exili]